MKAINIISIGPWTWSSLPGHLLGKSTYWRCIKSRISLLTSLPMGEAVSQRMPDNLNSDQDLFAKIIQDPHFILPDVPS